MRPRDRVLAAIRHEPADRVATDAICVENQAAIAAWLNIDPAEVEDRLGLDGRIVSAPYLGEWRRDAAGMRTTEWGTPDTGDYGTARAYPLAGASSVADVERYPWPDPGRYDFAAAAADARQLNERYAVRGPYWVPLFCQVCDLFGMEDAMLRMLSEPAVFEAALEGAFQFAYAFCEHLLEACGDALPILCLGDDFATQRGMLISPGHWRRLLKPRFARLFELGKRRGRHVWFHSCGDVTPVLPDLIDIGVDVWETVQLHALPMTARQLKRAYGRHLTFFGGVNTQRLPFVTPAQVRDEVARCIEDLGEGGGYICGPDHHIKPDVPPANAVALFDAAAAFRRAGYTLSA
jgi:uroporphyrinogen decarboxylase